MLNPNFDIEVETRYNLSESRPEHGFHFFNYKVTIKNKSNFSAQLLSRHWIITDTLGKVEEVRGPGVVGLQPKIPAGKHFEYESGCPLTTSSGSMKGTYQMMSEDGQNFEIQIPEFYLVAPTALH
jgi:ApaG protein